MSISRSGRLCAAGFIQTGSGEPGFDLESIQDGRTEQERTNVQNFLRKMKKPGIIVPGESKDGSRFWRRKI
jgi:hypothetical protein